VTEFGTRICAGLRRFGRPEVADAIKSRKVIKEMHPTGSSIPNSGLMDVVMIAL
jgi:hypothetical protein